MCITQVKLATLMKKKKIVFAFDSPFSKDLNVSYHSIKSCK